MFLHAANLNPLNRHLCSIKQLSTEKASAIASLLAIGCRSGDTVVGLSSVRRQSGIAIILADESLSVRTLRELADFRKNGVIVFKLSNLSVISHGFGRSDISVVAVKQGPLAEGIFEKIER